MASSSNTTETTNALRRVRAKIENPEHWTQLVTARDAGGSAVASTSPDAVRWCLMSAMGMNAIRTDGAYPALVNALPDGPWTPSLGAFNDDPSTTHADVIALIDRAIASAEMKS